MLPWSERRLPLTLQLIAHLVHGVPTLPRRRRQAEIDVLRNYFSPGRRALECMPHGLQASHLHRLIVRRWWVLFKFVPPQAFPLLLCGKREYGAVSPEAGEQESSVDELYIRLAFLKLLQDYTQSVQKRQLGAVSTPRLLA